MGDNGALVKKYERYKSKGQALEVSDLDAALNMYKAAEEMFPNTMQDDIARVKAKKKLGGKSQTNVFDELPPPPLPTNLSPPPPLSTDLPPPPIDDPLATLPDFSANIPIESLPPPPPLFFSTSPPDEPNSLNSSSSSTSPPHDATDDELELFIRDTIDFIQVLEPDDIEEMVRRKDNQLITYLLSATHSRPPSYEHSSLAIQIAKCFAATCEVVPSIFRLLKEYDVTRWVIQWCTFYIKSKTDGGNAEKYNTEHDDDIIILLKLLSILCGDPIPLRSKEKDLLDDQAFVTMMVQFAVDEWDIYEESDIAFAATSCLCCISSQFSNAKEDPIILSLYLMPQAAELGRNVVHVVNRGLEPKWLQNCGLSMSRKIFEYSQASQSTCYFFTNVGDMHVLLDVILREIVNLDDEETTLRMSYLQTLRAVVTHFEYINKGRYKHDDVAELLNATAYQEYDEAAAQYALSIFEELINS